MSRLIIKNLPKNITEAKIRTLFMQKGNLTDVQLKYTADGKCRNFGFVGYKTEQEAEDAINHFHNTYISSNRISVELCVDLGDVNKSKPWSKHSMKSDSSKTNPHNNETNSEKYDKPTKKNKNVVVDVLEKHSDDPLLHEYLQSHMKGDTATWRNDIDFQDKDIGKESQEAESVPSEAENVSDEDSSASSDAPEKLANQQISDMEYMNSLIVGAKSGDITSERKPRQKMDKAPKVHLELFTVKMRDLPYTCKKRDLKTFFHPLVPFSIRIPRLIKGFAYIGFKTEKDLKKALLKDRSFIAGKRISVMKYVKHSTPEDTPNQKVQRWKNQEESLKIEEEIAISGRIFIRNLAYTTTEEDVQKVFEKYGPVSEINLPVDKATRQMKGFGTITFVLPEHASKAYGELDGTVLNGRMLHLLPAKALPEADEDESVVSNYKEKKAKEQKKTAGSAHNWNSLFVASNAVVSAIADSHGTTREAVLGTGLEDRSSTGTSAAVRLALGETQIVHNIKMFLENHDVHLDAFNMPSFAKKSKTVILVKNLPNSVTENEISKLFNQFGVLGRVVMPPNGITAVVEFIEPSEARQAFSKLAYMKFKSAPLYLEWAPEGTFTSTSPKTIISNVVEKDPVEKPVVQAEERIDSEENIEPETNTVLFVKNLNFATTDNELRQHFEQCGKLKYATVATKKNTNTANKTLSMGYGFVRFLRECDAEKALKTLQYSNLDGKSLELKRSERTSKSDEQNRTKKSSGNNNPEGTKILIRNIPFQANKYEIKSLFTVFGEIKALRLPKKLAGSGDHHRGFAFVEFIAKDDAKRAFVALSQSTHLYGRRLVLEWAAKETDDVSELRKRTAKQFTKQEVEPTSKKSVLDI